METYIELARTWEALSARFREVFKSLGLTAQQYNVLRILYVRDPEGEGLRCQEIGARLVHRVPDITRLLDRLEKSGWILRERSQEDRRAVLTRLTSEGLAKVEEVHPELMLSHRETFSRLDEDSLVQLRDLLRSARAGEEN